MIRLAALLIVLTLAGCTSMEMKKPPEISTDEQIIPIVAVGYTPSKKSGKGWVLVEYSISDEGRVENAKSLDYSYIKYSKWMRKYFTKSMFHPKHASSVNGGKRYLTIIYFD